ncbi:MAG: hypothetical protein WBY44_29485 [Bryobacteraceae bacterium]
MLAAFDLSLKSEPSRKGASLERAYRQILAASGLHYIRIDDLRYTAAILLVTRGVHPRIVTEIARAQPNCSDANFGLNGPTLAGMKNFGLRCALVKDVPAQFRP